MTIWTFLAWTFLPVVPVLAVVAGTVGVTIADRIRVGPLRSGRL